MNIKKRNRSKEYQLIVLFSFIVILTVWGLIGTGVVSSSGLLDLLRNKFIEELGWNFKDSLKIGSIAGVLYAYYALVGERDKTLMFLFGLYWSTSFAFSLLTPLYAVGITITALSIFGFSYIWYVVFLIMVGKIKIPRMLRDRIERGENRQVKSNLIRNKNIDIKTKESIYNSDKDYYYKYIGEDLKAMISL